MLRWSYAHLPFKQPVYELLRRLSRLPERLYQHLHFTGIITVPIGSSCAFRIRHYGYEVENDLFWAGFGNGWEGTSLRVWARLARGAQTIFDIGANTGVYALAAKTVSPKAAVIAFEPVARIAAKLSDNIALNDFDIEVVLAGVSGRSGETVIFDPASEHAYSASLNPDMLAGNTDLRETLVTITRMDEFVAAKNLPSVDLVKIDAEKHEVEVLLGFGDLIADHRPTFLIEVLDATIGKKVKRFFEGLDYVFYEINEGQEIRQVTELGRSARNHLICTRSFAEEAGFGKRLSHEELSLSC